MCDELKSGGSDNGDDVLTAVVGWAAEVVSSVVAGFERIGREEQECDATLKTNIYCTAPSPQHTRPDGADEPSAASALGSAGDGDDARQRESGRGPGRHTYSYATMSVSKRTQRGKKKKAQTVTGGGEAGAAAQSASS